MTDVAVACRAVLKKDSVAQAELDKLIHTNAGLEELISVVAQPPEGRSTISDDLLDQGPPPVSRLVEPLPDATPDRRKVAVLVRSHVLDEKFEHLWRDLNGENRRFDVFPLLDRSALGANPASTEAKYPNTIWCHSDQLPALGLTQKSSKYSMFWLAGDLAMIIALIQKPRYNYYIMIDYDVHFTKDATAYVNRLCDRLADSTDKILDGVGLEFKSRLVSEAVTPEWPNFMDWEFYPAAAEVFHRVYHFYFPFVTLSRRAVLQVFAQRQLEAARRTPGDKIVNCEAFVPSSLMAAGLRCADLNDVVPGSYELDSMGLQHLRSDRLSGQPLNFAIRHPQPNVEMIHAVYSQDGFLERNLNQRGASRAELEWFSNELIEKFASSLDAERLETYLERAREKLAML